MDKGMMFIWYLPLFFYALGTFYVKIGAQWYWREKNVNGFVANFGANI
jgi:hypothetical protein